MKTERGGKMRKTWVKIIKSEETENEDFEPATWVKFNDSSTAIFQQDGK